MLVPGPYSALKWEKGCNNTNTFVNEIVSTVNTVATVLTAEVTLETLLFGSPPILVSY